MLVEDEVIAGGHRHPVVGESLQVALTPGNMGRVASNLGRPLPNLPPDIMELLLNFDLALFSLATSYIWRRVHLVPVNVAIRLCRGFPREISRVGLPRRLIEDERYSDVNIL